MNISAISSRTLIGRFFRAPLRLIPDRLPMPVVQGPLRGWWWIAGSSNHGCWLGSYEYTKQRHFASSVRAGYVVFDVGANVGFYTLLASRRVGIAGRVIAFEPLHRNVLAIERHIALNDVRNATVIEAAVADSSGEARFASHESNSMGRLSNLGDTSVRLVTLDDLIADGVVPNPDVLKIDVEGAELRVLKGAVRLLGRSHVIVYLATHGVEIHRECCDFLRGLAYDLSSLDGSAVDATDELVAALSPRSRGRGLPPGSARA